MSMEATLQAVVNEAIAPLRAEIRALAQQLPAQPPQPEWLTAGQAADLAGKSRATIRRWAATGLIEPKGHGHERRFSRASIMERAG